MVKRRKKVTELERNAYHEAGHAVMAYILQRRFHFITIDPDKLDENTGGLFQLSYSSKLSDNIKFGISDSRALIEKQIKITLAGAVACGLFVGREKWKLSEDDGTTCFRLADTQCGDAEEADAYLTWLRLGVRNELNLPHNWARVRAVAEALMKHKTLSYRKAREIIQTAKDK
jgi:hypothetical protein